MTDPKPFRVFDFRTDVANVLVMPEIRGRFLRMEPGEVGPFHSHDVGQEVFIVLEGECEFLIAGHREVLGPGQMCVARANELHEVRVVGDAPMTMYLSVTPHLEPTHTFWDGAGRPLPPEYGYWAPAGLADYRPPTAAAAVLAERFAERTTELERLLADHRDERTRLVEEIARDDEPSSAKEAVDQAWPRMREAVIAWSAVMAAWNDLAVRVGRSEKE